MAKTGMLDPIVRALVGVPQERLGVILDAVNKVGSADGARWKTRLAEVLREKLESTKETVVVVIATTLSLAGIVFSPETFIGKGWSVWRGPTDGNGLEGEETQDVRALAMTELDVAKMQFEICLADDEKSIKGEEKLKRLLALDQPLAGGRQFLALWRDYQANKENSVLEWLRRERGIAYLDFFGTILRVPHGHRFVLSLYWYGGEWYWFFSWLDGEWDARYPSAVLAS